MKQKLQSILIALLSFLCNTTFAHQFEAKNDDGVTIYYNIIDNTEVEVCYRGSSYTLYTDRYSGVVNIPDSVTYLGTTYPVKSIGRGAFARCSGLTYVNIPNTVTRICLEAFSECSGLTSINISNSVTIIEERAFEVCGLTTVNIPNSVNNIGRFVFSGCSSLTSVTIPNSVTRIEWRAFSRCSSLTSVTIPSSVTSIEGFAFSECSGLKKISIPKSVTTIGESVFEGCTSLDTVYCYALNVPVANGYIFSFSSNKTIKLIVPFSVVNDYINNNYWNIPEYNVTSVCKTIEVDGFSYNLILNDQGLNDAQVTASPNGYEGNLEIAKSITYEDSVYYVTSIGSSAFSNCAEIKNVTLPNSVTNIGANAFEGCSSLTRITIPSSVKRIEGCAFFLCSSLTSVTIPNSVTRIGGYAFSGCRSLTSITIPDSVITIEGATFQNCSSLTSITIPDSVINIGFSAFENCSGLTKMKIPNSVTDIGNSAFRGCSGLTSIEIPNSVTNIGSSAFSDCKGLTSVTIPDSVSKIEKEMFYNCSSLLNVNMGNSITSIGEKAFYACSSLSNFIFGNSVTIIGPNAFRGCIELTSLTIPNSVIIIEDNAFDGCTGLKSLNLGNSVTKIGSVAFYGCKSLRTVTIPPSVTNIGGSAFSNCSNLKEINFNATNCSKMGSSRSPVFKDCYSLTTLNIGDNVKMIPDEAFFNCSELNSLTIPASVNSVGNNAFWGCRKLTSVYVTDISAWCSINFGSAEANPLFYANHLYLNDEEIVDLIIPESITTIRNFTFNNCVGLTSVTIPSSVNVIGESAFSGCSNLLSLSFPESISIIKQKAFNGCSKLPNVTIPASVEYIYQEAFSGCISLKWINIQSVIPPFSYDNTFGNYNIPLIVPMETTEAYKSAQGWKNFTNISEGGVFKLIYIVDGEEYKTNDFEIGTTITPEAEPTKEGHTFSGWSEIPETMPANDVTITGTFTINKYKLTYSVDGEEYKDFEVEYGTAITAIEEPTKEGYTFSGWSDIPESMPANDVTITGSFTVNTYTLTYMVDGEIYKTIRYNYEANVTPEAEPTKEGYTFSDWSDIPETMPANDVTITGTFTINKYKLTYSVDGEEYKDFEVEYGTVITAIEEPTKEGYTFSGWSEIPETMPANEVSVSGKFAINTYQVTYMIGGEMFKTDSVQFGAQIVVPEATEMEGYTFDGWADVPKKMPAHDIIIYGTYTSGIMAVAINEKDVQIYDIKGRRIPKLQRGVNIIRTRDGRMKKVMVK